MYDIFKKEAVFVAGADKPSRLPIFQLPECAFIGKSNVGKSSLINALCNNKNLARISNTPGRTQQINFFQIAQHFILVDLPGYGFAKVPDYIHKNWEQLILTYLQTRLNLKKIYILIDSRRGIKDHDLAVIKLAEDLERPYKIVFTKSDKREAEIHDTKYQAIYTSSKTNNGIKALQMDIINEISM